MRFSKINVYNKTFIADITTELLQWKIELMAYSQELDRPVKPRKLTILYYVLLYSTVSNDSIIGQLRP